MGSISVDREHIREQFRQIESAAEPMASLNPLTEFAGNSQVMMELMTLCTGLYTCSAMYVEALQEDSARVDTMVDSMIQEDERIGEVMEHGT